MRKEVIGIYDVVACGSCTIDVFGDTSSELIKIKTRKYEEDHIAYPSGVKILLKELTFKVGGGGVNAAVVASKLGLNVAYLGNIGLDANGDFVLRRLKHNKVEFIGTRTNEQTGYSIILDSIEQDRTILKFSGANDHLDFDKIDKSLLRTKWFYMTSMIGQSYNALERLAKFAHKHKIKVAFNPSNYLIKDNKAAIIRMVPNTDMFMVNEIEAYLLTGQKGVKSQLAAIKKMGAKMVLITEGPEGAGYTDGYKFLYIKAHKVNVVEVTGAGDTFGSSFISGLIMKPGHVKYALKLALLNAESVIRKRGAHSGLLSYSKAMDIFNTRVNILSL